MNSENKETSELLGLGKLKDKLLNLNPLYNRKIRFYTSERLSWDLAELLNKSNPRLVNIFASSILNLLSNSGNCSLDLEPFFQPLAPEDISKFQKKIIHLQKKNLAFYQEKGHKSLFLGVVFLHGYFYNNKNILRFVNAPLFLLPCDLEKIKNLSLVFRSERKINYNLLYYLQKELGLAKKKFTDFLSNSIKVTPPSIISSLTEKEKTNSAELNLTPFFEIKPNDIKEEFLPKPFVRLTFSNKPNYYPENQLKIVLNFCLTIDSEPNLSLFRDFEEIIQEYSRALNLLRGEAESMVSYSKEKETSKQAKPLYTPFPSDPSQTRILKVIFQHFSENALCIDGPPGTGKSQLICNLLANSLADQKKVLVICEKEVALKVIYDKLTSIGLNLSIIKINELAQTPQVYRDILNHIENNQPERTNRNYYFDSAKQIADLEEKQASNLKKIANYCQVENEFQTYRQISLQEVYLKFDSKQQLSPTLIQLNKSVKNKEQLEKLKFDLGNYISKFKNQNNFQEIISSILRELKGEKTKTNLLSRILRIKLVQECSKNHQSIKLLENKIKDLEELQAEPRYQNFFIFLQIENFADFWQKFNFDENTKKNIDYFFQRVLVDQEFNYLNNYTKDCEQAVYFNWIKEEQQEIAKKKNNLVKIIIASITNRQEAPFDFLVFDEASQVPLEKKQEEEEEKLLNNQQENINIDIDDLEKNSNLLSYAKKYVRNKEKLTLLYHYRSRYPELIEFSNQAFYNGILQIVSASELRRNDYSLIEYHYQTKGCWINTENQVEARYIIELLKTLPPNKEIGIITFNVKQRDLLIDSITEGSNYKNLFIKNLEEVQGDERDIIIFSTGYGPNKEGKIFLNFGPLNNEGGEKRLNVAISRAREKMIIVTSLLPDDLKRITEEDENRKPGPKLFKNGELAEFGSLFEEQVYNELISQNYTLANRIECDGEYWHGKTENIERDIYRQQLLEDKVNFMIILALETSCDETSVAILENKKVLSNITISQILEQQKYGGVMPSLAAKLHIKNIQKVLSNALSKAKISPEKIDYIAYTEKPGLIICLQIGKIVAETLSLYLNKPLITCNHLEGHIYASFGGHTQLYQLNSHFDFVLLGETLDDAIGECLDKSAILLGYDYPGGPIIEKLALKGKNIYKLPFPKNDESLDFSFSGLKSEISRLVSKERENINANNLACSLQDENYSNELIKKEIEMLTIGKYVNAKHDYLVEGLLNISNFTKLKSLYFFDNKITKLVIDNCPKIKFINCCGNFLTDLDFLSNLNSEKITNIHLRNNNISERDLSCFSRLVNLTTLLIGNSVESKIQKGIFNRFTGSLEFLKDLTMLKRLDIRNTDIDSGLEYLPNSVKEFHCSTDERKESKVKEIETELEPFLINFENNNQLTQEWQDKGFNYNQTKD
ncbi:3920_t:CDS:10 [Entrophospora sp. SA101]|nr:3920_t:CDS:10 [Entrophospora sp. SA101]